MLEEGLIAVRVAFTDIMGKPSGEAMGKRVGNEGKREDHT